MRAGVVAAAVVALGLELTGCSGSSSLFKQSPPPTQPLQFESLPPGADVSTGDGQTCKTPCSLAVPLAAQAVNFTMNGYSPQTVSVRVHQDNVFSPSTFAPNPVSVTLQAMPKPAKPKARKATVRPKAAAKPAAPTAAAPAPASPPAPAPAATQNNVFPTPPPMQSPVESRFPTPAEQQQSR